MALLDSHPVADANFLLPATAKQVQNERAIQEIWSEELNPSNFGSAVRQFFPDLKAVAVIGPGIDLMPCMVQLVTGHCALNAHQFRFGFRAGGSYYRKAALLLLLQV